MCVDNRFCSGFNPSGSEKSDMWLSPGWYGLDQGVLVMMIENYRSGLIWNLMRSCPYPAIGLRRAGFEGGWL